MADNKEIERLANFKKSFDGMVDVNDSTYLGWDWRGRQFREPLRDYSKEEIEKIVNSGSLVQQAKLSQNFFNKKGFYFMTCMYYATLLKYLGVLIPNPKQDQKLDSPHMVKRYNDALNTVEAMNLQVLCGRWALKAIINGCYYGVIVAKSKEEFVVLDLPAAYCANNYKDLKGNYIIEFNLAYFDSITSKQTRKQVLKSFPDFISDAYRKWKAGKGPQWIFIPGDMGVCFPFVEGGGGRPPFLCVIPASLTYDDAVDTELDRAAEEIRKILVQKVPHNASTNELVFEPDEAYEMHRGAVNMMKNNPNVDVLTTYADVDAVVTKGTADRTASAVETMASSVYYEAGITGKLFGIDTATGIDRNTKVTLAIMMNLANRFSVLITNVINELYKNSNISFTYKILPISYQNDDEYLDNAFKMASSGYSLIVPALALGISQRDLSNLKELENDVMKLPEVLIPLSSAFTQSANSEPGAPKKDVDDKNPHTVETEISAS